MPKRLLRGVIDFKDQRITDEQLDLNFRRLLRSGFDWHNPDEAKIYEFVKDYVVANHEIPSASIIKDYFQRVNELTVIDKLDDLKSVEVYVRTHYKTLLNDLLESQNQNKIRKLLQDVEEIVTKGRTIGLGKNKETLKGARAALQYFNESIYELIPPENSARTEGEVLQDAPEAWQEYQTAKVTKDKVYGKFTGIEQVDQVCHGIKRGELWIHAAAPGQLKTTFALNWAYNLATRYRSNVLYVSLEMKYEHLRRLLCAIHTANGAFAEQGYRPLDYRKIRDGELSPEEEIFYQAALKDFETNPEYCRIKVWAPDRNVTIEDIRVYAELLNKSMEVGLVVIDHSGLVEPSKENRNKDYTVAFNSVIRSAKKMTLFFNGSEGIPILLLHQVNRQGLDLVEKKRGTEAEGLYTFSSLSYANEAEKSADYVTSTYLNEDLKQQGTTIMANLKNRDNDLFRLCRVRVDFASHRMRTWEAQDQSDIGCGELSAEDLEMVL